MNINELAKILQDKQHFDISSLSDNKKVLDKVEYLYSEICLNKTPTHIENLKRDIKNGLLLELAAARAINGKFNSTPYDKKNWMSFTFDVFGPENEKIEVKRWSVGKNLNINLKTPPDEIFQENIGYFSYYDTFYKNCFRLDFLIAGDIREDKVIFKRIIDAKSFKNYLIPSKQIKNNGSTHFYADTRAKADGNCIDINY